MWGTIQETVVKHPIPMTLVFAAAGLLSLSTAALAQEAMTIPSAPAVPAAGAAGPAAPLAPEAADILKVLHDRKDTLKDFTGKIDYSVEAGRTGDVTGKRGTVDFINDPTKGPTFSADFTVNTKEGKPSLIYHVQFIFDGRDFTIKDFGTNNNVKQFVHSRVLPDGAKPGDAVTLKGPITLPIGLDVNDVAQTFEVTVQPGKEPGQAVLRFVPREKGKFDYTQLEVTVDKRPEMQIPVKLVHTAAAGDVTTITLTDVKINSGGARLADASVPADQGWTEKAGATRPGG